MLIIGVLIFAAGLVSLLKRLHRSSSDHHHTGPTNVDQHYATALELALQFFDIQKCTLFLDLFFSTLFVS